MISWKSVFAFTGFAVLSALIVGVGYEQVQRARDRELYPQIGRPVNIGGRSLNLYCSGSGSPAVIFQSGAPWPLMENPKAMFEKGAPRPGYIWTSIQRDIARSSTACWYDRAGSGWSDPGPYPRDAASQARDLHALLRGASVPEPYVLVAEYSAALDARKFAGMYPAEVAGMVLVNGVHPDVFIGRGRGNGARFPQWMGHSQDVVARFFNGVGFYRLGERPVAPAVPDGYTSGEWNAIWNLAASSKARAALLQEIGAWPQSTAQARAFGDLGTRPLMVVSSRDTPWMDLQRELARMSTRGRHVVAGESGDLVYYAPAEIVSAVREVIGILNK